LGGEGGVTIGTDRVEAKVSTPTWEWGKNQEKKKKKVISLTADPKTKKTGLV